MHCPKRMPEYCIMFHIGLTCSKEYCQFIYRKTDSIILICSYLMMFEGHTPDQALSYFWDIEKAQYHDFSSSKVELSVSIVSNKQRQFII